MASKFVLIGNRVVNLKHVAAAERDGNRGRVTLYLTTGGDGLKWVFDNHEEADLIWNKLTAARSDMTDLGGGPYSITDNEATASRQPRE